MNQQQWKKNKVLWFPSPLEVDRFLYLPDYEEQDSWAFVFPSPSEVDRYLYGYLIALELRSRNFRPLSRWIGSYTSVVLQTIKPCQSSFRPLSRWIGSYTGIFITEDKSKKKVSVPSRGGQVLIREIKEVKLCLKMFPSPLEVDRFLYPRFCGWF